MIRNSIFSSSTTDFTTFPSIYIMLIFSIVMTFRITILLVSII